MLSLQSFEEVCSSDQQGCQNHTMIAACQDPLDGTAIKVYKSSGAHTKTPEMPQKKESLLSHLEDAMSVERPCEDFCDV